MNICLSGCDEQWLISAALNLSPHFLHSSSIVHAHTFQNIHLHDTLFAFRYDMKSFKTKFLSGLCRDITLPEQSIMTERDCEMGHHHQVAYLAVYN